MPLPESCFRRLKSRLIVKLTRHDLNEASRGRLLAFVSIARTLMVADEEEQPPMVAMPGEVDKRRLQGLEDELLALLSDQTHDEALRGRLVAYLSIIRVLMVANEMERRESELDLLTLFERFCLGESVDSVLSSLARPN